MTKDTTANLDKRLIKMIEDYFEYDCVDEDESLRIIDCLKLMKQATLAERNRIKLIIEDIIRKGDLIMPEKIVIAKELLKEINSEDKGEATTK